MKHKIPLAYTLFAARMSLILLIGATILEIVLMVTANMGAVWNNELRRIILETVFLVLVFFSVGTLIVSIISKRILRPFHDLQNAIHQVSKGNFNVRVEYDANNEFSEVVNCFNQMVVELNGIQTMRNDFINTFSHECKIPVACMSGFAKQLKRPELTEEEREEYLDIIIKESDRLIHLYHNILALSRYQNQHLMTNLEEFSLDESIRRCVLLLEKDWVKKNLELDIDLEPVLYYGNEEMLSQVWINILNNAVKFTQENGLIQITCKAKRNKAIITIKDNGVGMDQMTMNHMFDSFFSSTANNNQGNGIGLAIVKRIVELCQGRIDVSSGLGQGTEIVIKIPLSGKL